MLYLNNICVGSPLLGASYVLTLQGNERQHHCIPSRATLCRRGVLRRGLDLLHPLPPITGEFLPGPLSKLSLRTGRFLDMDSKGARKQSVYV